MLDFHATRSGDEEEIHEPTLQASFDKGSCINGVAGFEIHRRQRLEGAQRGGEFVHMTGLAGGEVGGFEIPGVVFALGFTTRVCGGGVGLVGSSGQTGERGTEVRADLFEQAGFHLRPGNLARRHEVIKVRGVLTIYTYQKCGTCREALKWLDGRGIPYQVKAVRETPPTMAELKTMLKAMDGDVKKLFNTSGVDYRELGMKDRLLEMSEIGALELLATNGNLVKRPFVMGNGRALVGFQKAVWQEIFADLGKL
jgi:arsenate reductase (glutaredoxin)